jgi:alpha-glucosidase
MHSSWLVVVAVCSSTLFGLMNAQAALPVACVSPDGRVRIEVELQSNDDSNQVPCYRVSFNTVELLAYSRLGLKCKNGTMGQDCEMLGIESRAVHDQFTQITGKQRKVSATGTEVVITFRERSHPKREWAVVLRAYNDGVALRYRVPKHESWEQIAIVQELTQFNTPAEAKAHALPLNGFTTSYEKRYQTKPIKELPQDWLLGLPLLLEYPEDVFAAITEADVTEYAGLYLAPVDHGHLAARLSPLPKESGVAVRSALPHVSPWRVMLIGDCIGQLIESNLVLQLNGPCAIKDTSWIKTGKTTFPWWNGFYEENVDFKPGLNTATAKHYIDFCAEAGIPYHSLDGMGNTAWYGGPIVPYKGADITKAIDGLDLPEVLAHAKKKDVRIRLWMHWQAAEKHMAEAFPKYKEWGIEGVMLDFMDRDDQEMNRFVRKAVQLAAENHLTVTLHGCPKPTGLERTYPNLLTHEGVMNLEYDKWDTTGITPEHELTVPFTRMLAGPLDFHQGSFRTVKPKDFKPRNDAPLVMGTPARTLASYVVYQNHLPMVADYPSAYRKHPATTALAAIPTTWDETKVLKAKMGEYIVVARRSSNVWHVGVMTDSKARSFQLPLKFTGAAKVAVESWIDDDTAPAGIVREQSATTQTETITVSMAPGGGAYLRLTCSGQ